eukprot:5183240-Prymnesium_polylepis.1
MRAITAPLIALAAGNYHSCALTEEHALLSWGEGRFGRLGHGTDAQELTPRLINALLGVRIIKVACGGACTAAIDENGALLTWGSSTWDQCAHCGPPEEKEPKVVSALEGVPIASIACAEDHMVALGANGAVYSWGRDSNGRLGGTAGVDSGGGGGARLPLPPVQPVRLPYLDGLALSKSGAQAATIVAVSCRGAHSLLLTSAGKKGRREERHEAAAVAAATEPSATHSALDTGDQRIRAVAGQRCTLQAKRARARRGDPSLAPPAACRLLHTPHCRRVRSLSGDLARRQRP